VPALPAGLATIAAVPALPSLLANWIPDPHPDFGASPTPFVVLMLLGFFVAIAGHITKFRTLVVLGIGMIFLATLVLPYATYLSKSGGQ
jgi:hypothetical protein